MTADNIISLPDDSNISRYHARIEQREDGFWLVEQGSSNGTAVNGSEVDGEILLQDGDTILLGGTSEIIFSQPSEKTDDSGEDEADEAENETSQPETEESNKKGSSLMLVAGAVVGLAVISTVGAGLYYWSTSGNQCDATARIKKPSHGEIITKPIDIKVEVQNSNCVDNVVLTLDGKEFASTSSNPYTAPLDPSQFADKADGINHNLRVILLDKDGEPISAGDQIEVGFETLATPTPTPEPTETPIGPRPPKGDPKGLVKDSDILRMARILLNQNFPKAPGYKLDPQFLSEVNKKTAEFAVEGYFNRAAQYRDVINVAYVTENNLDAPLGYILAMSRSKFNSQRQGADEGLWRMSNDFVTANAFNGMCGTETLSDASQNCAAKSSALYLKAIVLNVFEGDIIYSLAAFGMSPQEAAEFKARVKVTANRMDFWRVLTPKQREEVVRFFAAGIVAENPPAFGLKKDRPLSELYPK